MGTSSMQDTIPVRVVLVLHHMSPPLPDIIWNLSSIPPLPQMQPHFATHLHVTKVSMQYKRGARHVHHLNLRMCSHSTLTPRLQGCSCATRTSPFSFFSTPFRCRYKCHGNSGSSVRRHVAWFEGRGVLIRGYDERLDRRGV